MGRQQRITVAVATQCKVHWRYYFFPSHTSNLLRIFWSLALTDWTETGDEMAAFNFSHKSPCFGVACPRSDDVVPLGYDSTDRHLRQCAARTWKRIRIYFLFVFFLYSISETNLPDLGLFFLIWTSLERECVYPLYSIIITSVVCVALCMHAWAQG